MSQPAAMKVATWPQKGDGRRNLECGNYDECLDQAARLNWEAFNCEKCALVTVLPRPRLADGGDLDPTYIKRPAGPVRTGRDLAQDHSGPVRPVRGAGQAGPNQGDPGVVAALPGVLPGPGQAGRGKAGEVQPVGEEPMNELSPDTPRCKKHKDRPAIIRSDGRSSGKCRECMRCSTKETWSNKYDHETIKKELEDALAKTGGSRAAASRLLGISEASLYRRVKKYGMTLPPAQCGTAAVLAIAGGAEDQAKRTPVVGPAPVIGAELQAAAERVDRLLVIEHGELGPYGDLVLAAKELTTTLRLAARLGAIPGWPGEKE